MGLFCVVLEFEDGHLKTKKKGKMKIENENYAK